MYGTTALLLLVGLGAATAPSTAAPAPAGGLPSSGPERAIRHVTLITGDTVGVDRDGRVVGVQRSKGRSDIAYTTQSVGGRTMVIPADAVNLLNSGRLDRRLFDITQLIKDGYTDERSKQLPLIVSYKGDREEQTKAKQALIKADADVQRQLPAVHGQSLTIDKPDAPDVWKALTDPVSRSGAEVTTAPGVGRLWLDAKVKALPRAAAAPADDGTSTAQIGAPDAWKAGWDGKGTTVAVLDTGIDATHPDLKDRILASKDFSGSGNTDDKQGHGTHVASSAAGTGAASGGKYKGVAPGARLLNGKVLGDDGTGSNSDVIAGMQWAVDQGAKIVNMSLGGPDAYTADVLEKAVDELSASTGALFVVAAGNDGPADTTLGSPGSAQAALTVAAVNHEDALAKFSSRGPTADGRLKPDISAPGVDIVAAKAKNGWIGRDTGTEGYVSLSGTSMATPHVAGAAAILAQQHPDWNGDRIKAALMGSVKAHAGLTAYEQGSGRVDLTHAITQTVVAEPASLDFGTQAWPHDDDTPVTRPLTYRNTGSTPVTLNLETSGTAGVFTVSPATLTIPAGGTATATVTGDTRRTPRDGVHSGAVTAASPDGRSAVRTPGLIIREPESYDLTIKSVGKNGKAPEDALATLTSMASGRWWMPYERDLDGDFEVTMRLPKGRYLVDDWILGRDGDSVLVAPNVSLTKDTTLVFDQRKAKKIKITAPVPGNGGPNALVQFAANRSKRDHDIAMSFSANATLAQVGPSAPADSFVAQVAGVWQGTGPGKPQYNIVVSRKGSFFTGLTHTVRPSTLARIDMAIGSTVKNSKAEPENRWMTPGFPQLDNNGLGLRGYDRPLPTRHAVTYLSADGGLRWHTGLNLYRTGEFDPYAMSVALNPKRYEPGRTYREGPYNKPVLGPLIAGGSAWSNGYRLGNGYALCVSLNSDGRHYVADVDAKRKTVLRSGHDVYLDTAEDPCGYGVLSGLPKERTPLTLTMETRRDPRTYRVSDHVKATWTFTSQYVDTNGAAQPFPLSNVRFTPKLSLTGTAKAGKKTTVPLVLQGPASVKGHLKSLAVQVSYDGGRTWRAVSVRTDTSGKRSVTLTHPARPGTVSFKAALADTRGNTYTGTINNAYRTVR